MKPNAILRTINANIEIPGLANVIQINYAIETTPGAKYNDIRALEIELESRTKTLLRQLAEEHAMLQNYNGKDINLEAAG